MIFGILARAIFKKNNLGTINYTNILLYGTKDLGAILWNICNLRISLKQVDFYFCLIFGKTERKS